MNPRPQPGPPGSGHRDPHSGVRIAGAGPGAEPQIETEHDAGGANHLDHVAEIGERRAESLQPDHVPGLHHRRAPRAHRRAS